MPQASNHHKRCRKPQPQSQSQSYTQHRSVSFPQPKSESSNKDATAVAESKNPFSKNPRRKKFVFVKIKGLGCKGNSMPAPSAPRAAAELRQENQGRRKPVTPCNRRNPGNVVVDVPDVCCTPPGIGIASDFAPRNRNTAASSRLHPRKHSREARRNVDGPTVIIGSRTNHRSTEETIQNKHETLQMLMAQQTLLYHRIINSHDQYQSWRLNVDDMTYEELLDLSDRIGHVGTGLKEEQISTCLRKFKHNVTSDSTAWIMTGQKDWRCSICQEKCRRDDQIGRLECGHYHHVQCIKQWLLQKNQCPVCKSAAMPK